MKNEPLRHKSEVYFIMRLELLSTALLLCFHACTSLPFRSRGKTGTDTEDEETKNVRGASAEKIVESSSSFQNAIVEAFFQQGAGGEEDGLKEEIQMLTSSDSLRKFLSATRRTLHRHPELMYQESFTSETIQTVLDDLNIPYTDGWAKNTHQDVYPGLGGYGVVAHIGSGKEPCIILRADMDALPIEEKTENIEQFKSKQPGKMHACGHDGHVTMLLGAAALLKSFEDSINGTIRLVFQPAEEGGAGAKRMVEEGVVEMKPKAELAFGMHVWPTLPTGAIASRPGALMAAAETFEIVINGKGGHAAMPHLTIDPIVATSSLVMNLQTVTSRTISPLESGVVSITQFTAGDAFNVIPASVLVRGTIRALSTEMLMSLRDRVEHIVNSTATLHGCTATIRYSPDFYPPTINHAGLFDAFSKDVGAIVSKEGYLRDIVPTMGGEDFSFIAQTVPSTFFMLGQGSGAEKNKNAADDEHHVPRTDYGLHHPSFALDEDTMPIGVELHVNLALRSLRELNGPNRRWEATEES